MLNNAKLLTAAVSLAAGFITPKVVEKTWAFATGEEPPESDESGSLSKAIMFAVFSAVAGVIIQRSVMKVANRLIDDADQKASA